MCSPIMLPAMQLVCNLTTVGYSGDGADLGAPQSPLQHQYLPEGYNLYYQVTTYKFYDDLVTWLVAKEHCTQDGAHLAVIDSSQKLDYVKSQMRDPAREGWGYSSMSGNAHAGIIRMDGTWVNVNTGSPVLSIPWDQDSNQLKTFDCAAISIFHSGLIDIRCSKKTKFICELPIPENFTSIVVN